MTIPSIDLDVHISTQVLYAAFCGGTFPQYISTCGLRIMVSATHCSGGMAEWRFVLAALDTIESQTGGYV